MNRVLVGTGGVAVLVLVLSVTLSVRGFANGPEIGHDAGMIFPIESTVVHLVAESVDVRYDWRAHRGTAECVYYLWNESDSTRSFDMAFVTNRPFGEPGVYRRFYDALDMTVRIDGRDVPVAIAGLRRSSWLDVIAQPPDSLPAWPVSIAPRDTIRVAMAYRVSPSGGSDGHQGGMELTYRCRPAALWAGRIDRAVVRFTMSELDRYVLASIHREGTEACLSVRPSGWSRNSGAFEWSYRDWEPDQDISIGVEWK